MSSKPILRLAILVVSCACLCEAQVQDPPPSIFITQTSPSRPIPFDDWLDSGERKEIPWRITVSTPRLSYAMRMRCNVIIHVPIRWFRSHPGERVVISSVRFADTSGRWVAPESSIEARTAAVMPPSGEVEFAYEAFLLPGEYTVAVVFFDLGTGLRSVARRHVSVRSPTDVLLLKAWQDLPAAEFIHDSTPGLDRHFLPHNAALTLPVENREPVQVEIILNFSPSEELLNSGRVDRSNVALLLSALRVFSDLSIACGSVRITALDVNHRRILFEQNDVSTIDWPALRAVLSNRNTTTIDAGALAGRRTNAVYFRDVLFSRLTSMPAGAAASGSCAAGDSEAARTSRSTAVTSSARRVIILLRSPTLFARGTDFTPLVPPADCNCTVYDLQFRAHPRNLWDDLGRVIKPLRPRTWTIDSPDRFRRALSEIHGDLSR